MGALPAAVHGVRGASLHNIVYMVGKRDVMTSVLLIIRLAFLGGSNSPGTTRDDIWKYDADTKRWEKVGKMLEARWGHAVTTVTNKNIAKYCNN